MTAPIQQLFALCKQTLTKNTLDKMSREILSPIISSLNKITNSDICFDPDEFKKQESRKSKYAPVSYMELYRDDDFSMAVFIVKAGSSLPLHDHSCMFGLLKVIYGSVKIVSYNDSESPMHGVEGRQHLKAVSRNPDRIISTGEDCCVLTPTDGNLHEIQPLSTDFVAFLDVLTPSYNEFRSCNYWQEVETRASNSSNPNIKWLLQVPEPPAYWCDSLPYKGPELV